MKRIQSINYADQDIINAENFAKNYLTKSPKKTQFKTLVETKMTHSNHFNLKIEPIIKENIHEFIFDSNITDLSITYRNICIVIYCASFSDIKYLNIRNRINKSNIFGYSGDEINMMMSLNSTLYNKCNDSFNKDYIIVPINQLLFVNNNICLFNNKDLDLVIDIEFNKIIQKSYLMMDAYNLTNEEANRMFQCGHEYFINDYLFLYEDIDYEKKIELKYYEMVDSIVIDFYNKDNDKLKRNKISLDKIPFIGPEEYPFIPLSSTPNLLQNGYFYLVSDSTPNYTSGRYVCNPRTLHIKTGDNTRCVIMIKFFSHMNSSFVKAKLYDDIDYDFNYPLTKVDDNNFIEGYWSSPNNIYETKKYPYPKSSDEKVSKEFINKLEQILKSSDTNKNSYFGFSICRLCGCNNGAGEYKIKKNNITFTVPEGLIHYYKDHNVQPSKEFYDFIMQF